MPATPSVLHVVPQAAAAVVHGAHFHARESVRVALVGGDERESQVVLTTATGTFVVRLRFAGDPCSGGSIRAVGSTGDRASAKLPLPQCPPA